MREIAVVGLIAWIAGLASYYVTGELGLFSIVNLGAGALGLAAAAASGARRVRAVGGPDARAVIGRGLLGVLAALLVGVALERGAAALGARFDWTLEERFEVAEAVLSKLDELAARGEEPVQALLFFDPDDPRVRRTRLLLDEIARTSGGQLLRRDLVIDANPEEVDLYEVGSSNTVSLVLGDYFETVPRPTQGALYEGLYHLADKGVGFLLLLHGEGEGDPGRSDDGGYSGLAAALQTEGYDLGVSVTAGLHEVPPDVDAVLAIAPERHLLPQALAALRRYLDRGGSLVALIEPGRDTGLEALLADWGIEPLDGLIVDPESEPIDEGSVEGIDLVASSYQTTPVTHGLNSGRMTYFPGARPLQLRKPRPEDRLEPLVYSSGRSWITSDLSWLDRSGGAPENAGERTGYQPLAAAGQYRRDDGETRILVFGDAQFASNRWLRTLYNLDLVLNAVHWATRSEPEITLRPKVRTTVQFPMPIQDSVKALYGIGLLIPEILLIVGALVWLRRRTA